MTNYAMLAEKIREVVKTWDDDDRAAFHEQAGNLEDSGMDRDRAEFLAFWPIKRERKRREEQHA